MTAALLPEPVPATELPYAAASADQRTQALVFLRQALSQHFPTLPEASWQPALDRHQPLLWLLADGRVEVDFQDVTRLAQHLAGSAARPNLDPPLYGHYAAYLARRLHGFSSQAAGALAELEANPTAVGPRTYELIATLAAGNATAATVLEAFGELAGGQPTSGRPAPTDQQPGSPAVRARLDALSRARGTGFHAPALASPSA